MHGTLLGHALQTEGHITFLNPKLLVSRELEEINLVPDLCTQPYLLLVVKLSVNVHTTFIE